MFQKMVAVEPVNLMQEAREDLKKYAHEIVFYDSLPADGTEMAQRIGNADAALISYTSQMGKDVLERCPNLRYVGMCCSLYEEKSANVDIAAARELGIVVKGVRDYGDQGVGEYAVSELVRYLHGFGEKQWKPQPVELEGLKVGVIGLGASGIVVAEALHRFGAEVCYFSRTRKEAEKFRYLPLNELLEYVDAAFTCLTKNTVLLYEEQFQKFGNHKILFNTCIGPSFDPAALENWLAAGNNEFFCDMPSGLGPEAERLMKHPHVNCAGKASGTTEQAMQRLGRKVLENIDAYFQAS
ncbi:MAG: dihydrofolate reductase [Oscillibacter sp.]|nr:dihydrofolate reductase [Oscillibacter sp.]MCI9375147.1 dihydrofolate reductase [Oscillibacter sp.]